MSYSADFPDPITLYLIEKLETVQGKKAFQKLMYFINLETRKYKFKWDKYGPFSEELSYILDDLVFKNYVTVNKQNLLNKAGTQYNLSLADTGKQYLKTVRISGARKKVVNNVIKILGYKSPRKLELLASVHYILSWARMSNRRLSTESIFNLICELKPDSGFSLGEVKDAIRYLETYRLI